MFDWLFEGRWEVYLILAIPAVVLGALWVRDRKRGWLYAVAALALLAGVYFLLDRLVETHREQIARKLQEMGVAVKKGDTAAIFKHISPQFKLGPLGKDGFRKAVDSVVANKGVDELVVDDIKVPDHTGKVEFRAKPKGPMTGREAFYKVRGEFVKDSDGEWRLKTFEVYNPVVDTTTPLDVGSYLPR